MPEAREWVVIALSVIKEEAGDRIYDEYKAEFEAIVRDQVELRTLLAIAEKSGDAAKEAEYRSAYEATVLDVKNIILAKKIDVSHDALDVLATILRTVFRLLSKVVLL